jgi:hypothetical protein
MDAVFLEGCLAPGIKTCCPVKASSTDPDISNLFESFGGSEAAMLVVMVTSVKM